MPHDGHDNPTTPPINIALQHHAQGRLQEAENIYRQILQNAPDQPVALHYLGVIFHQRGDHDTAVDLIAKALAVKPDFAEAHCNLALALQQLGRGEEAVASYGRAILIEPNFAAAHCNLGVALHALERQEEAVESYNRALALKPDYAEALSNRGNVLTDLGRLEDALDSLQRALDLNPNYAKALNNLGNVLRLQGHLEKAAESYAKALTLSPNAAKTHCNLGAVQYQLGQLDEAVASFHRALSLEPGHAETHINLGYYQLLTGDFQNGWENYGWRWHVKDFALQHRRYQEPMWDGSSMEGKKIYIYPEQGLGDCIQFVRYLKLVEERGGRVIFESPAKLEALFQDIEYVESVVTAGHSAPPFDCHASLLDLPGLLNTTLETIPSSGSYLRAPTSLTEKWRNRLGPHEGFRVGIVWAGNPKHNNDLSRSIPFEHLRPLLEMEEVEFYSLQVGERRNDIGAQEFDKKLNDLSNDLTDFANTAGVIEQLDLVISVDTSVAHLAGALGRPVWTLLPLIPDWRWLLDRADSPWYSSMQLFRQERFGAWNGVVENVCQALAQKLSTRKVSK